MAEHLVTHPEAAGLAHLHHIMTFSPSVHRKECKTRLPIPFRLYIFQTEKSKIKEKK